MPQYPPFTRGFSALVKDSDLASLADSRNGQCATERSESWIVGKYRTAPSFFSCNQASEVSDSGVARHSKVVNSHCLAVSP